MEKTVLFFNPFSDFTHTWDKEPYSIRQNERIYLPDWLAKHLAKHLVDRELNWAKLPTDFECADPKDPRFEMSRSKLLSKCIFEQDATPMSGTKVKQEVELMNKNREIVAETHANQNATSTVPPKVFCDSCDSKGVKHKKECPKNPARIALAPSPKETVEALNATEKSPV